MPNQTVFRLFLLQIQPPQEHKLLVLLLLVVVVLLLTHGCALFAQCIYCWLLVDVGLFSLCFQQETQYLELVRAAKAKADAAVDATKAKAEATADAAKAEADAAKAEAVAAKAEADAAKAEAGASKEEADAAKEEADAAKEGAELLQRLLEEKEQAELQMRQAQPVINNFGTVNIINNFG